MATTDDDGVGETIPLDGGDADAVPTITPGPTSSGQGLRGRRVGSYTLIHELGHGGQGFVWLAEDTRLHRKVALKMLTSQASMSEPARLRFLREAEVASKLDHPGICGVYEFGEHDGVPFIAMPYLEGEALDRKIATTRHSRRGDASGARAESAEEEPEPGAGGESLPTPGRREILEVLRFIEQAARALHVAHETGLVHRDIKPGNIMSRSDGSAVILDFGLARDESGWGPALTQTGDFFGTPAYMSPEQLTGQRVHVDRRSDIYSLGVTLFECLTLRRPFEAPNREALYQAILSKEPPRVRRLNPAVSKDLEVVVACALEKDRERRYQTALDLAEELKRVREHEPIVARPVGPWTRTMRWAQRNPTIAALLVVVFAALGATVCVFAWKNREVRQANTLLMSTNAKLDRSIDDLRAEKERVQRERDRVARLKDRRVLRRLQERADALFPAHPDLIGDLEEWLGEADDLLARTPVHRESLAALEASAGPYTDAWKARDHPEAWPRLVAGRARLSELNDAFEKADSVSEERSLKAEIERAADEVEGLEAQVAVRRTWGFDDEQAWRHELLRDLVGELAAFGAPGGMVAGVRARLATAEEIGPRTLDDHAAAWKAACARILTSEKYGGFDLEPRLGLIPLGPDPATKLEEFLHWASHARGAPRPERGADGRFEVAAETGIILVLLPGGSFLLGSQSESAAQPNHDPDGQGNESPVHEVTLQPFFVGKHEVTRAQYVRMSGKADPSLWDVETSRGRLKPEDLPRLPVDEVDWFACHEAVRRADLALLTEARWEYACRAGSDDVYSFGDDVALMPQYANVADRRWAEAFDTRSPAEFSDGHAVVAPVGTYEPNAFGLHDMHGNAFEWCADWYSPAAYGRSRGERADPSGPASGETRILRGGSWRSFPGSCRSSCRSHFDPSVELNYIGFRVCAAP